MTTERFSRQEILGKIGTAGQKKLSEASVAVVGVGGLGSVAAELLCRAGVGNLVLIDHDVVQESNLHRQFLYAEEDVGKPKSEIAKEKLQKIWKDAKITAHAKHLDSSTLKSLDGCEIILDGTDNFETRFLLNDYALKNKKLFIYAGAIETRGLVFPVIPKTGMPSLEDVMPSANSLERCETVGIINTANVMTATLQATLAMKWTLGKKLEPCLYHLDIWTGTLEKIKVAKGKKSAGAEKKAERKEKTGREKMVDEKLFSADYCLTKKMMRTRLKITGRLDLAALKRKFPVIVDQGIVCTITVEKVPVIVYEYGELLFPTLKDEKKIEKIASIIYAAGFL